MPGGDGTGPGGTGPMTGRAAGYCAGYSAPGYANPVGGRGYGFGFGRGAGFGRGGRGRRNRYYATGLTGRERAPMGYPVAQPYAQPSTPTKEQEMEMLKGQSEHFQNALSDIQKRISELEADTK
ncbi:MAG: hypothetical protein GF401_02315 [Chitinivibrionales bacterium]|nr:hypothetical protein [Chitinivibrionales bacterium]